MDTQKAATRGGLFALAFGIADAIATRAGVAAGLFTDFPGFFAWALQSISKAASGVSADTGIIILGALMLAWGWLGERIKGAFGRALSPGSDAAGIPLEELRAKLVTLEAHFQDQDRRITAAVECRDALQEEADGLKATLSAMAEQLAAAEKRAQEEVVRVNAAKAVVRELSKAATGRSFEILIDNMITRFRKLVNPNAVHEYCGSDEGVYLKAAEDFKNDLLEYSKPWPRNGWPPYEATIDRASNDCARELMEMGDQVRITAKEMEDLRKRTFARHLLELTAAFLEAHRKEAVARQRDFINTPFRS